MLVPLEVMFPNLVDRIGEPIMLHDPVDRKLTFQKLLDDLNGITQKLKEREDLNRKSLLELTKRQRHLNYYKSIFQKGIKGWAEYDRSFRFYIKKKLDLLRRKERLSRMRVKPKIKSLPRSRSYSYQDSLDKRKRREREKIQLKLERIRFDEEYLRFQLRQKKDEIIDKRTGRVNVKVLERRYKLNILRMPAFVNKLKRTNNIKGAEVTRIQEEFFRYRKRGQLPVVEKDGKVGFAKNIMDILKKNKKVIDLLHRQANYEIEIVNHLDAYESRDDGKTFLTSFSGTGTRGEKVVNKLSWQNNRAEKIHIEFDDDHDKGFLFAKDGSVKETQKIFVEKVQKKENFLRLDFTNRRRNLSKRYSSKNVGMGFRSKSVKPIIDKSFDIKEMKKKNTDSPVEQSFQEFHFSRVHDPRHSWIGATKLNSLEVLNKTTTPLSPLNNNSKFNNGEGDSKIEEEVGEYDKNAPITNEKELDTFGARNINVLLLHLDKQFGKLRKQQEEDEKDKMESDRDDFDDDFDLDVGLTRDERSRSPQRNIPIQNTSKQVDKKVEEMKKNLRKKKEESQQKDIEIESERSKMKFKVVINELIGSGGFSSVFSGILSYKKNPGNSKSPANGEGANSNVSNNDDVEYVMVAIKKICIKQGFFKGKVVFAEVEILRKLMSRFLVRFYGCKYSNQEKEYSIIMEYMDFTLTDYINKKKKLSEKEASIVLYHLLKGLEYLQNEKIIHRDMKSSNILLNKKGEIKITDFGVSAIMSKVNSLRSSCVGTPNFSSVEILRGQLYSYQTDTWSLGCVVLNMLTGEIPFFEYGTLNMGQKIIKINVNKYVKEKFKDSSKELRDFLLKCFIEDWKKRPLAKELLNHPFVHKKFEYIDVTGLKRDVKGIT